MDAFEWFGLSRLYHINKTQLRKKYLLMSREIHPDKASDEMMDDVLNRSTYHNQAYSTLMDDDQRLAYLLQLEGILIPGEPQTLPQVFLMEMMDINLALEDAIEIRSIREIEKIEQTISAKIKDVRYRTELIMNQYDQGNLSAIEMEEIKSLYYILKYLLRINERLSTFASA